MSLTDVPRRMPWDEAWRITKILLTDPTSWVHAALAGWQFPEESSATVLRDLYDLQHRSKAKRRPKPYPRPWDRKAETHGDAVSLDKYRAMRDATESR